MSNYLRVTRDDYAAIRRANALHNFGGPLGHFRRFLEATLHSSHPALSAWVGGLSKKHVRILRVHLAREARSPSRSSRNG